MAAAVQVNGVLPLVDTRARLQGRINVSRLPKTNLRGCFSGPTGESLSEQVQLYTSLYILSGASVIICIKRPHTKGTWNIREKKLIQTATGSAVPTIESMIFLRYGTRPALRFLKVWLKVVEGPAASTLLVPGIVLRWCSACIQGDVDTRRPAKTKTSDKRPRPIELRVREAVENCTVASCGEVVL